MLSEYLHYLRLYNLQYPFMPHIRRMNPVGCRFMIIS